MVYSLELTHEYTVFNLEKEPSFTIDKIAANDFYYSRDDGTVTEYWVEISRNGELIQKINVTITSKKLKNKKALFVKARAYVFDGKTKVYGKWSAMKKMKIK